MNSNNTANKEISDKETIDIILNGNTPEVAKQAAQIAAHLYKQIELMQAERDARKQATRLATVIDNLAAISDFRQNDDGSYRYPDSEVVLGRDDGTLTRGDIRYARAVLNEYQ